MSKSLVAAGSLVVFLAALAVPAHAKDQRLECDAEGPRDISMDADYEIRGSRERFSTDFEADSRSSFKAGQKMTVVVDQVKVGSVKLRKEQDGDIVGDLNLGRSGNPIPKNFPKVRKNTKVQVRINGETVLGCRLKVDD